MRINGIRDRPHPTAAPTGPPRAARPTARVVLGAAEPLFTAPLAIEPINTTTFSGGAVAYVFAANPC